MSDVLKGVEWVAKDHKLRQDKQTLLEKNGGTKKIVKSTANMSLGGGKSRALDNAIDAVCLYNSRLLLLVFILLLLLGMMIKMLAIIHQVC